MGYVTVMVMVSYFNIMALSSQVEESLKEAEANLRNALAYAARGETPTICHSITDIMTRLRSIGTYDKILDKLQDLGDDSNFSL